MLFQGLSFIEGSVFGITLQKILELLPWNLIAITQGTNFVGIVKVKLAFRMGKFRVAHTCTTYYRKSPLPTTTTPYSTNDPNYSPAFTELTSSTSQSVLRNVPI